MTTYISTAPEGEADYTSPSGVPDYALREREARLWLLSQAERDAGGRVEFDPDSRRWVRAGVAQRAEARCECCQKIFNPARTSAKFCSATCRVIAGRKRATVTLTGRLVPQ